jgi:hypothetical protein
MTLLRSTDSDEVMLTVFAIGGGLLHRRCGVVIIGDIPTRFNFLPPFEPVVVDTIMDPVITLIASGGTIDTSPMRSGLILLDLDCYLLS